MLMKRIATVLQNANTFAKSERHFGVRRHTNAFDWKWNE